MADMSWVRIGDITVGDELVGFTESPGPDYRPLHLGNLAKLCHQATDAGLPVFVKQDSARLPGQQGRLPADLWALKQRPALS